MSFPPPPTSSLNWPEIGFRLREVNGHIESRYTPSSGWSTPKFVRDPYLRIHGMAPGLNYGQQAFEGMKAFRLPGDSAIAVFRPDMHAARMQHSAEMVSMPQVPVEHFKRCVQLAIGLNAEFVPPHDTGAGMYVRPLMFASQGYLPLNPPCEEYMFVVYVMPTGVYHGAKPVHALILEEFDRAAPFGVGNAKLGGNYAPVFRWSDYAKKEGFGITLHLDSKTRSVVDEFSTSGFIGIKKVGAGENDYLLAVPNSTSVIKSVTSESTIEIARSLGWKIERREITYQELKDFTEIVAVGTAAALVAVKSITMKSKGESFEFVGMDDTCGPAQQKLIGNLQGIQRGKLEDSHGWLSVVKEPEGFEEESAAPHADGNAGDKNNVDSLP